MTSLLLQEIAPDFAAELHALLQRDGDVALAAQVQQLMIFERCRCGDSFCSTFYTAQRPEGSYPPGHPTLALLPGEVHVDVVGSQIVCVEVLYATM